MAKNSSQSKEKKERLAQIAAQQKKKEQLLMWAFIIGAILLVAAVAIAIIIATQPSDDDKNPDKNPFIIEHLADSKKYLTSKDKTNLVKLNIRYTGEDGNTHIGDVIVELDPDNAPITVANFQKLVSQGFYDGLTFHRIRSGFMIQGGDPKGNGTGGSDEDITGEFSANGIENNLLHERGVISMARSDDYNSASSQFFIVHKTSADNSYSLDGKYAAFGKVIFGMETVDAVAAQETDYNDRPLNSVVIQSATFVKAAADN